MGFSTTWALLLSCIVIVPLVLADGVRVMAMAADVVRDLDEWLKPFLEVLGRKTRRSWAPLYVRGLLGLASARACSRWRCSWDWAGTISCSTSSPARPGMTARCGRCWRMRRTG